MERSDFSFGSGDSDKLVSGGCLRSYWIFNSRCAMGHVSFHAHFAGHIPCTQANLLLIFDSVTQFRPSGNRIGVKARQSTLTSHVLRINWFFRSGDSPVAGPSHSLTGTVTGWAISTSWRGLHFLVQAWKIVAVAGWKLLSYSCFIKGFQNFTVAGAKLQPNLNGIIVRC